MGFSMINQYNSNFIMNFKDNKAQTEFLYKLLHEIGSLKDIIIKFYV